MTGQGGKLSFKDLTPQDKILICNGCGGKGSWIDPPDFLFHASCDWHDFEYWRGGTEVDRYDADLGFYKAMRGDADRQWSWWNPLRFMTRLRAWTYYRAVRWFGKGFFHHGKQRGEEALAAVRETARQRNEDQA